jgi:hypothetical protein
MGRGQKAGEKSGFSLSFEEGLARPQLLRVVKTFSSLAHFHSRKKIVQETTRQRQRLFLNETESLMSLRL